MHQRLRWIFLSVLVLLLPKPSSAVDASARSAALQELLGFAQGVCSDLRAEGDTESIEAGGKIDVELTALLSKLARLGISGSGQYNRERYRGCSVSNSPKLYAMSGSVARTS